LSAGSWRSALRTSPRVWSTRWRRRRRSTAPSTRAAPGRDGVGGPGARGTWPREARARHQPPATRTPWAGWAERSGGWSFVHGFTAQFGHAPTGLEQGGYDAVQTLALALRRNRGRGGSGSPQRWRASTTHGSRASPSRSDPTTTSSCPGTTSGCSPWPAATRSSIPGNRPDQSRGAR
jgi:hypothetical protein